MRQSVLKRSSILKELLAPYRLSLFVTIFFGIISGTATVLMTYYIGLSIDALSLPNSSQPFSQALQRFLLCLLLASTTQWLLMRLANKISYQSVTTLRKKGWINYNVYLFPILITIQKATLSVDLRMT